MKAIALGVAVACAAAAACCAPRASAEAPLIGVAGVPRELGATRDYDRIFRTLAAHGIDLFYPAFQYVEAPESASLGFEVDFIPPCRPEDPAFAAMRTHRIRLIVPAGLLYDRSRPLPPLDADPLKALNDCAGQGTIYGVLSYDEPSHNGIPSAATEVLYDRIKTVAPDLPVLMVHAPIRIPRGAPREDPARLGYLGTVAGHSRHADIVGFDTYPVPASIARVGAPGAGSTILEADAAVRAYLNFIKGAAPDKKYLAVLQNFSPADQYAPDLLAQVPAELRAQARAPSAEEMEAMMRAAAANGASVVIWYGAGFTKTTEAPEWRGTLEVSARFGSGE